MAKFQVAPQARADVAEILAWSLRNHGPDAADRYSALILHCFDVIEADPVTCSHAFSEATPHLRLIHLRTAGVSFHHLGGRVKKPRHVVLFRLLRDGHIEVSRVLHERMDFDQELRFLDFDSSTDE